MHVSGTSEKVRFYLDGAVTTNELDFVAFYADVGTALELFTGDGTSNGTTAVDMVTGAASTQRAVKTLMVYNADTAAAVVNVEWYDGTNSRQMIRASLATQESLHWHASDGWQKKTAAGADT